MMNVPSKTASFTLALALGVAVYVVFRYSTATQKKSSSIPPQPSEILLRAPASLAQQGPLSNPPPPPKPLGEPVQQPPPEPQRALVGTTTEQLKQIEHYLPAGSRVATYPVSETEQRAAFATDNFNTGNREIVVVYETPATEQDAGIQPLFLGVLTREGDSLTLCSSARLYGGLIYISLYDKQAVPFAIRDVTGDGRPEIVVTSGVGASLGGALQVYSLDGSSLHQIAFANGHTLHLNNRGPGKPSEITAQSRYEDKPRVYRWNGERFESKN